MSWRCAFGIHDWTQWEIVNYTVTRGRPGKVWEGLVEHQVRKCKRCGKTQAEMV